MKYSLRSLMIAVALLPPLLAAAYWLLESLPEEVVGGAILLTGFLMAVLALSTVWVLILNRL